MAAGDAYFNVEEKTHLEMLPSSLRDNGDLKALAAEAEALVLARFTITSDAGPEYRSDSTLEVLDRAPHGVPDGAVEIADGTYVILRLYDTDPSTASAVFAKAFRREVANLIRWLAPRWKKSPNVSSESAGDGAASKDYREDSEELYPPGFGAYLRPFKLRGQIAWGF